MSYQDLYTNTTGYYGPYGGCFVPEILKSTLDELTLAFEGAQSDPSFWQEYQSVTQSYSGRPTPVTEIPQFAKAFGKARVFCKREDLNQTGAHKINNVLGQGLLVQRMGKPRVIAETGAGQHGIATATMAARYGLECTIYMGAVDVERQRPNVFWMEQMGAEVVSVTEGTATLKDAINAAMRDWATNMDNTHYALGTVCGPHPFPRMVSYFHSITGVEAREQIQQEAGTLPTAVYACVGGGSNASGILFPFLDDANTELVAVEAGGHGIQAGQHAARMAGGSLGVAQGYKTYFLQNSEGQMNTTHSIAAGLDYIGVGPILSHLYDEKKIRFEYATDDGVIEATKALMKNEGLIPALESAHAFAGFIKDASKYTSDDVVLINLSGRGDKDIFNIAEALHDPKWDEFLRQKVAQLSE